MADEPKYRDEDEWDVVARGLKKHSTADIERAIGKALSELAGTELRVSMTSIKFGAGGFPSTPAKVVLRILPPATF